VHEPLLVKTIPGEQSIAMNMFACQLVCLSVCLCNVYVRISQEPHIETNYFRGTLPVAVLLHVYILFEDLDR